MYSRVGRSATSWEVLSSLCDLNKQLQHPLLHCAMGRSAWKSMRSQSELSNWRVRVKGQVQSRLPGYQETMTYPTQTGSSKNHRLKVPRFGREYVIVPWRFKDALNFSFTILTWHQSWSFSQAAPTVLPTKKRYQTVASYLIWTLLGGFPCDLEKILWPIKRQIWV